MADTITNFIPTPTLNSEWVRHEDVILYDFAQLMERMHMGKKCVGFEWQQDEEGKVKYKPVLIDAQ